MGLLIFLLPFLFLHVKGAKIAVVSYNLGASHTMFAGAIADTLVDAGHTVHFFQVQQDEGIRTNGSIKAHRFFYIPSVARNIWNDMAFRVNPFKPVNVETPSFFVNATMSFDQSCHVCLFSSLFDVLASREWIERLGKKEKYDIGISEAYGFHGFGLLYMLKVREYILSTAIPFQPAFAALFNIPTPVSYVTSCLDGAGSLSTPNLSYPRRIYNTALHGLNYWIYRRFAAKNTAIFRRVYPDMPDLETLVSSASLILVNTPALLELPRPTTHKVLHIGGLAESATKGEAIGPRMLSIVNGTRPVVVVSFGTLARTIFIEGDLLTSFLEAFGRFPDVDFIWKFDEADIHNASFAMYPNVYPFGWLPQKRLLNHPNTIGFVSHVGLNSLLESAQAGVPLVAIPLFTDQQYNSAIAVNKGIAVYVDKAEITAESVGNALHKILFDRKYASNSRLVRAQLKAFPRQPPKELASFVEYIAKFGAPRGGMFELPSHSFIFTYSLDIFVPAAVAAAAAAAAFVAFLIYMYGFDIGILKITIEVAPLDYIFDRLASIHEEEEVDLLNEEKKKKE